MPASPRLKTISIVKVILAYEQMKREDPDFFDEMVYLIKGVSQKYIRWKEVTGEHHRYKRLPGKLEKLQEAGYFKAAGKQVAMVYITDEGRERLREIFDILQDSCKTIKVETRYPHGTRDRLLLEKRGLNWRRPLKERMKKYRKPKTNEK